MRIFSLITALGVLTLLCSCTAPQSERCKKVCQQETECAAQRKVQEENFPYDLDECIAACVALERGNEGRHLVEKHVDCANNANGNCEALMQCR
jgi:hypothetical protein